jgi:Flp pilus assembly protein TadD
MRELQLGDEPSVSMTTDVWRIGLSMGVNVLRRSNLLLPLAAALAAQTAPSQLAGRAQADEAYQRGIACFQTRQMTCAEDQFRRSVELRPQWASAWKGLGTVYAALAQHLEAQEPLRKACELDRREPDACYYLARNHYLLNQFDEALAQFRSLLGDDPQPWRIYNGIGLALEGLGKIGEAERAFLQAIEGERGRAVPNEDPRINLGNLLLRSGRIEESLAMLDEAVAAKPSSSRAHFELGKLSQQEGRYREARDHLMRAVELDPRHGGAHALLGKVYYRLGDSDLGARHTRLAREALGDGGNRSSRP